MSELNLHSLRTVAAVARDGSLSRAAAALGMAQSAASRHLAEVEQALGGPLFHRTGRGVAPTPAGQALLEHARTMLFSAERLCADMASFHRGIKGQVKVVASASAICCTRGVGNCVSSSTCGASLLVGGFRVTTRWRMKYRWSCTRKRCFGGTCRTLY